jgi:hypothetical protein
VQKFAFRGKRSPSGAEEENFLVFDVHGKDVLITAHRLDGQPLKLGKVEAYNLAYYEP